MPMSADPYEMALAVGPAVGAAGDEGRESPTIHGKESLMNATSLATLCDTGRPPLPPVPCEPWCSDGRGHTNEIAVDDQSCWGPNRYVDLSLHATRPSVTGGHVYDQVGAGVCKAAYGTPELYLHLLLGDTVDASATLTPSEARALAAALVAAAALIEGAAR